MPLARGSAQLAIVVIAAALTACHRSAKIPDDDVIASLSAASSVGSAFDPASLRGAPAIVMFVTPTCPHCRAELPVATHAAAVAGVPVIAVFVDGTRDYARAVVRMTHFGGAALIDSGALLVRYDIRHVPYTVVLAADGHARAAFIGEQDEDTLRDALADARR